MPTSYGKAAKAKATKLHSLAVRTRDGFRCRWCGVHRDEGKQIQCAHIISRSVSATRTDERNAVALCASCHWSQTKNPLVWARWIEKELGKEHLDDLLERGVPGVKVNWDAEVERLQEVLDKLQ
jgi:5-methylcytosine-specific restriction endonuclease McrA